MEHYRINEKAIIEFKNIYFKKDKITKDDIFYLHKLIGQSGEYKKCNNGIFVGKRLVCKVVDYENVEFCMDMFINSYNELVKKISIYSEQMKYKKIIMHYFYFIKIHRFLDGNGRVNFFLINYLLYKAKLPFLNIKYDNYDKISLCISRKDINRLVDYIKEEN